MFEIRNDLGHTLRFYLSFEQRVFWIWVILPKESLWGDFEFNLKALCLFADLPKIDHFHVLDFAFIDIETYAGAVNL